MRGDIIFFFAVRHILVGLSDEMGRAHTSHNRTEKYVQGFSKSMKLKGHMRQVSAEGRLKLYIL